MKTVRWTCAVVTSLVLLLGFSAFAADTFLDAAVDIPYQRFVLTNGLTLLVHEDHKAPIVAVNLWYHVGSKNERPGKTGFAHLFEHLMFTGSEHFKGTGNQRAFFGAMESAGATDLNGTTSWDRTDFFENVPKNALDLALWIESDRMGYLLGAIDQHKLDEQRGVVQNEKRQGENQPYGVTEELITRGTAPQGHPYSWTVIGSMEDLNAASLDDVKTWFTNYYGAANTVLVLAGDIEPAAALKKVEHYFGEIPAGPPVARPQVWVPQMVGTRRETVRDRVPQARLYKVWNIPAYGEAETSYLELVTSVLASGKSSRLYKRLVYDDQIATDVSAYVDEREIGGQLQVVATARPGGDLKKVEKAVDEEIARFLAEGPTTAELQRAKAGYLSAFVAGTERIGGFGGKSDILAMNETFRGRADYFQTILKNIKAARVKDLHESARRWLTKDVYILEVHPYPEYETVNSGVDRSRLPQTDGVAEVKFPQLQRASLSNGLKIILAERHSTPAVNFDLVVDAGSAADQFTTPGTAKLTMRALDSGTKQRTALQISDELALLGASLSAGSDLDASDVVLFTLKPTLDKALDIYADVVLNPIFPEADFRRIQKELTARIQQEQTEPISMALRVLPKLMYGAGHAYGNPLTGSGTEESIAKLVREDLRRFHDTWFKADNATLIVVGDTTLGEILPKLEKRFAAWKPGQTPRKNLAPVEQRAKTEVYLIDRPGSLQSIIFAGHAAPPRSNPQEIAIETMNNVLGGTFTSRLNMNLREDKHWSYGAMSFLWSARGPRPFVCYAPVQTDKTKESMLEMDKEIKGFIGSQPVTAEELSSAQKNQTLSLSGQWETSAAVVSSVKELVSYSLPEDYFVTYPGKVRELSLASVHAAAKEHLHPASLIWVVVGDRAKIESGIKDLGWADLKLIDANGNLVK